jgi:ATP-dependent helicase HrpB
MLLTSGAGAQAITLAALLAERDPVRAAPPDLALRMAAIAEPRRFEADHPYSVARPVVDRITQEARRLERTLRADKVPLQTEPLSLGQLAALAYPDRIGLRRKGDAPRWVLSGGTGAAMAPCLPLSDARLIVATDLDGDPREATVRQAVAITEADLRALYGNEIRWQNVCEWSRREAKVLARQQERYGALVLADRPWTDAPPDATARAALDGLRLIGLPWAPAARRLRARIELARAGGSGWPDCTDKALLECAEDWLLPHLAGVKTESQLRALDLTDALRARLSWGQTAELDRLVPSHFETPLGRRVPIDYDGDFPGIEIRLQELFGVTQHPTVGTNRLPLRITLLSPGQRPVQVTTDLPGFWANTYADVRRDMRGQYPRHPWPEDPTEAEPTLRAKPRGT